MGSPWPAPYVSSLWLGKVNYCLPSAHSMLLLNIPRKVCLQSTDQGVYTGWVAVFLFKVGHQDIHNAARVQTKW